MPPGLSLGLCRRWADRLSMEDRPARTLAATSSLPAVTTHRDAKSDRVRCRRADELRDELGRHFTGSSASIPAAAVSSRGPKLAELPVLQSIDQVRVGHEDKKTFTIRFGRSWKRFRGTTTAAHDPSVRVGPSALAQCLTWPKLLYKERVI
jgi:hypothetical protein